MKKLFLAVAALGTLTLGALEFRIEPESFGNLNGWKSANDGGSSGGKLLFSEAKGADKIASATFSCPEAGKYYVWVKTLTFGENWRKVQIRVNGKSIGKFGDEGQKLDKPKWSWKRTLAPVNLGEGEFKIEFIALGALCRVDCLVFTTDPNFQPAATRDAIEETDELEGE